MNFNQNCICHRAAIRQIKNKNGLVTARLIMFPFISFNLVYLMSQILNMLAFQTNQCEIFSKYAIMRVIK